MKKILILLCITFFLSKGFSQVSISAGGLLPDGSAMLDVVSTTKGALMPRMTMAQRDAIVFPANGLIIYQTDNTQGIYVNVGSGFFPSWSLAGCSGWSLTGNSGTVNGTHFIGTTDNVPFTFKVNNRLAGKIDHLLFNTSLGYRTLELNSTGFSNTAFGHMALDSNSTGEQNTATGYMALVANTTGKFNTAFGNLTLCRNKAGNANTATGIAALYSNKNGNNNTAVGNSALYSNTQGLKNTAIGNIALYSNTEGVGNTAAGAEALYYNTGDFNTATGNVALYSNTTGNKNTAYGKEAMYNNTTGSGNTASGYRALAGNNIGYSNTAMGAGALYHNNDRSNLVAMGDSALFNNGIGIQNWLDATENTALGSKALYSNTIGWGNTATGYQALKNNTTGSHNTAYGTEALSYSTTGTLNTATGYQALQYNNGSYNTANGEGALKFNSGSSNIAIGWEALGSWGQTGNYNVAIGNFAMLPPQGAGTTGSYNLGIGTDALGGGSIDDMSGNNNVATGYRALYYNTSGSYNTAIGDIAMEANTVGSWNTCIGEYTNTSINNLMGATSLGASAITNGNNKIVIGASIGGMVIGGYSPWSNLSDGRFKEDIRDNVPGLDFISRLRPVTYRINTGKLQRHITAQMPDSVAQRYIPSADQQAKDMEYIHTGFVAQEVEATAKAIDYSFDGVNVPKNPTDNYSLSYSQFVPSLVMAVKELNEKNKILQKQVGELEARIEKLEKALIK